MGTVKDKLTTKPVRGGFLAKMEAASANRERVFVAMTGNLCLEFRSPSSDAEFDTITKEAQVWASKRLNKTAPSVFINIGPKSPVRFGLCHIATKLMVAGYDGYDISEDGEITPTGDSFPPLTFEEWLAYAKDHYKQFDAILAATDRESVRAVRAQQDKALGDEGKE